MSLTTERPGVYVQEIVSLPASVAQVATAVPAFIGYTASGTANSPVKISSMAEYVAEFGGASAVAGNTITVTIDNDGATASAAPAKLENMLYYSMQLYFMNGGGPCYVVSAGVHAVPTDNSALETAITALEAFDEPTLIVCPDAVATDTAAHNGGTINHALAQCNKLQDRFVIADAIDDAAVATIETDLRSGTGNQFLKYGAVYAPYLETTIPFDDAAITLSASGTSVALNNETLASAKSSSASDAIKLAYSARSAEIAAALADVTVILPPSGAIAGVYCSVDRNRGVWKAPANVSLNGVKNPTIDLTDSEMASMNVDATSGKSINAIKKFTGQGTLVWGARTLAGNDNEWRYVPVRRLFNTVEESIQKATSFVVFEPNDANTWARTKAMIENYLNGLWRQGALAGATPDQAYFVNVGLGETMTPTDILEGKLIIEIGMAAVRPAEFIILKFSHKLQEA